MNLKTASVPPPANHHLVGRSDQRPAKISRLGATAFVGLCLRLSSFLKSEGSRKYTSDFSWNARKINIDPDENAAECSWKTHVFRFWGINKMLCLSSGVQNRK